MIPLRAEKRPLRPPMAVWMLVAVCVAVTVRLRLLPVERSSDVMRALAVVPQRLLASPASAGQTATLLTSAFLHAGWIHLAGNMLYLLVFGPVVQARLGWRGFLGLYLVSGVVGGLAFALTHPTSTAPLVGASGAIAGVLGAHLILEPKARITTLVPLLVVVEVASLPAAFVIALWFALQVAATVAPVTPGAADASVAWIAHVAGFGTGLALTLPAVVHTALTRQASGRRSPRRSSPRSDDRAA